MLRSPIEQAYPRVHAHDAQPAPLAVLAQRARWFALISAAVWLYAAWAPWVLRIPIYHYKCYPMPCDFVPFYQIASYQVNLLDPIALPSLAPSASGWALDPVVWGALTPLGLLIAICLWSRRFGEAARIAYVLWLVVMGSMATIALRACDAILSIPVPPDPDFHLSAGFGIFALLVAVGLLVGAATCIALRFVRLHTQRIARPGGDGLAGQERARARMLDNRTSQPWRVAGALMLTLGIACWGSSWLFLRWTPVLVPNTCPTSGQDCLGISASRAMVLGGYPFTSVFDPAIFQYAFPVLLAGGAVIALYVAWWPRLGARHWVGIALWLGLVTWAYSVANREIAEISYGFGFNPARYFAESLASIGIAVGFASLIPLFAAMYSRTKHRGNTRAPDQRAVV